MRGSLSELYHGDALSDRDGERYLVETSWTGAQVQEYTFFDGRRIARRYSSANTVKYMFADHLGSNALLLDSTGVIERASFYYPFGGEVLVSGSGTNAYKFTGKERDVESGLDNFGARYYSSGMGRFVTPDWSGKPQPVPYADLSDPQSLNLYAYVENNPLSRLDPNGHCDLDGEHHGWLWCAAHSLGITQTKHEQAEAERQMLSYFGLTVYRNGNEVDLSKESDQAVLQIRDQLINQATQNALARWNFAAPTIPGYPYMEKPNVTNPELQQIVDELYQPSDVVPGGTAGAVRYEEITGKLLSPAGHAQEAQDIANQLNRFLKNTPGISSNDQAAAKELIRDLENAVAGK